MPTTIADLATPPDKAMLDTNVLLAATDEGRAEHDGALRVLNEWPGAATTLYTSGQIIREYLAVATRPRGKNGLGMKTADALGNVRAIRERTTLLAEDARVADRLLRLLDDVPCGGRQVHDANVVATMLTHGIGAVVTMNLNDFGRFGQFVSLIGM
ncbi:MAG: type II toxin-antitoxin system VapC family toxin [Nocardiopsaceae bacterium]|nr:type II toxin-antitoxin system VapC family toxin [Nocardiopsaceae bacterium]